jgi:hypothetical protein
MSPTADEIMLAETITAKIMEERFYIGSGPLHVVENKVNRIVLDEIMRRNRE